MKLKGLELIKKIIDTESILKSELDISIHEIYVCAILHEHKQMKMGELTAILDLPLSTATGIVDKLVNRNLIAREKDPEDKRVILLKISDGGEILFDQATKLIMKNYADAFKQDPGMNLKTDLVEKRKRFISKNEINLEWD
ncbi:MAG: MarR family transcriptional regulator [Bacillota bacterium]|nr:MarR family transcriptional regulator [Bacillota bacterium]